MKFGLIAACAQIGVDPPQLRRRILSPAGVVDGVGGDVAGQVSDLASRLNRCAGASERAGHDLAFDAVIAVSVLHLERERAPDGVEAVDRIARNQRQLVDGVLRDEVPIDGVAKDFVDAHAVLIDREPLWRADDRRCDEAAIVEILLELIAGLVAERNTGQAALQGVQQVRRLGVIEIRGRQRLHVGRHLVAVDYAGFGTRRRALRRGRRTSRRSRSCSGRLCRRARRRDRRGGNDADFGKRGRVGTRRRVRSLLPDSGDRRHHSCDKRRPQRAAKCGGRTDATGAQSPPHGRPVPPDQDS